MMIPWYIKFLLWFRPTKMTYDYGSDDHTVILYYKTLGDKMYIIDEEVA